MLFCYSLTVLCIVLFTFQRPFLFSPVTPVVETEYTEREEHLGSQPFKVFFFFLFVSHIAKSSSSWKSSADSVRQCGGLQCDHVSLFPGSWIIRL